MRVHGTDALEESTTGAGGNRDDVGSTNDPHLFERIREGLGTGDKVLKTTVDHVGDSGSPEWKKDGLLVNVVEDLVPELFTSDDVEFTLNIDNLGNEVIPRQRWLQSLDGRVLHVTGNSPGSDVAVRVVRSSL